MSKLWVPVRGLVTARLGDREVARSRNLYVNLGYARLARFLANLAPTPPGYIGVGNGDGSTNGISVTPAGGDTMLGFELLRKIITSQSVISTYTVRLVTTFLASEVQRQLTELGLWDISAETGTATSGGDNYLTDTAKSWTTNQWAGYTVMITEGAGAGQKRTIQSNSPDTLAPTVFWNPPVLAGSKYLISQGYLYAHASINVNKGNQPLTVIWQLTLPTVG